MGSSEPTQPAISTAISLPQWMKQKMNDRYDIDQTFSPPSQDESFFYIRYPKSTTTTTVPQPEQQFRPITEVLEKNPDFSKHTPHCRQFIPHANASNAIPEISLTKPRKPQGTDDGEAAACGQSVVQVAQQMVAGGTFLPPGGEKRQPESLLSPPEGWEYGRRRGSKSLPASPLSTPQGSPRQPRRGAAANHNPYFTVTSNGQGQEQKYHGWILSGFFGGQQQQQRLSIPEEKKSASRDSLAECGADVERLEISPPAATGMRRNKSASVIGRLAAGGDEADGQSQAAAGPRTVRPKPSGLREMNFWSPTSM